MRSLEVKTYLFVFSPKCTFFYTFMFLSIDAFEAVNETYIFAKYRFRGIIYILVCLNQTIFKESIGGQTRGVKKVKKRSINSKLKNVPIYAFFGTDTQ